jgi:hypothetical protein
MEKRTETRRDSTRCPENPVDWTIRLFFFFLPHGFSFFQEGYLGPFGSVGYRLVPRTWMTYHPSLSIWGKKGI